jgi:hypothetical protein
MSTFRKQMWSAVSSGPKGIMYQVRSGLCGPEEMLVGMVAAMPVACSCEMRSGRKRGVQRRLRRAFEAGMDSTPRISGEDHPANTLEPMANKSSSYKLSHRRDPPDRPEDPGLRPTRVRRIHTLNCPRRNVWLIIHRQDDVSFQLN